MVNFHKKHDFINTAVLHFCGDFQSAKVKKLIEQEFGNWQVSGKKPQIKYPPLNLPKSIIRLNQVVPGKAQELLSSR